MEHSVCWPDDKKRLRLEMRKCLKTMGKNIKDHLPLTNAILHDLQCLYPLARKSDGERSGIGRLCSQLRKVTNTDQYCDSVCSEWLLYSTDSALDSCCDTFKSCMDMCFTGNTFRLW